MRPPAGIAAVVPAFSAAPVPHTAPAGFHSWSSNTVRTIQSATWFSAGKKLTVDKRFLQCGNEIYSAIKDLQSKAPDKNIVIFTHNHCLTYIAKDKRDATFKPDYLDGLVMHVEKGKVYLDGEFVNH